VLLAAGACKRGSRLVRRNTGEWVRGFMVRCSRFARPAFKREIKQHTISSRSLSRPVGDRVTLLWLWYKS